MTDEQLTAILGFKVPQIINEIVENEKISEMEAISSLYYSFLYSMLEKENTKLWHLSPKALYELYKQEKEEGKIDFPEEA